MIDDPDHVLAASKIGELTLSISNQGPVDIRRLVNLVASRRRKSDRRDYPVTCQSSQEARVPRSQMTSGDQTIRDLSGVALLTPPHQFLR